MEAMRASGRTVSIGVSNFKREHIQPILDDCTITPAVNQMEFHPQADADAYRIWLQRQDIQVQGFSVLAPLHVARGGSLNTILPTIAAYYRVNVNTILIAWALSKGVVSVSTTQQIEHIDQYLAAVELQLIPETIALIDEIGGMEIHRVMH